MRSYYLTKAGKKIGPFSITELEKQEITEEYMIWHEGMSEWAKVNKVEEIKHLIKKKVVLPPPTPSETKKFQESNALKSSVVQSFWWLLVIGLLIFLLIGGISSDRNLTNKYLSDGKNQIHASVEELRFTILPFLAFMIAFIVSTIICCINFNRIKKSHLQLIKN